ncbi:MAG: hypothetical protein ACOX6H_00680 [Christensenellales bacterium]|jgi:hypothetical protein
MRDLKTLAMQAKNRLKGYKEQPKTKNTKLKLIKGGDSSIKIICKEAEMEQFYNKFKDIINSDCIHNPIGCMIDKKVYNKLCDTKKELYFFETLEKYKLLKERCSKENNQNINLFA